MHTYTDPQRDSRQVQQLKRPYKSQHVQGHESDVHCMPVTVTFGQTWGNHVCISNCLNLRDKGCITLLQVIEKTLENLKEIQLSDIPV